MGCACIPHHGGPFCTLKILAFGLPLQTLSSTLSTGRCVSVSCAPNMVSVCRERRKLRFQELEEALNGLSEQMQAKQYEVAGLQNQNAVLQVCPFTPGGGSSATDALAVALLSGHRHGPPAHPLAVERRRAKSQGS